MRVKSSHVLPGFDMPRESGGCWFPLGVEVGSRDLGYCEQSWLAVGHWLLTAGYVVIWATAVVMWQRRNARLQKHSAAELLPDALVPQRGERK